MLRKEPPCYLLADIGIARLQRSCSLHSSAAKIFQLDDALCRAIHQRTDLVVVSWYASYEWNSSAVFLVHVLLESICSNIFAFLSSEIWVMRKWSVKCISAAREAVSSRKCTWISMFWPASTIITYTIRNALFETTWMMVLTGHQRNTGARASFSMILRTNPLGEPEVFGPRSSLAAALAQSKHHPDSNRKVSACRPKNA